MAKWATITPTGVPSSQYAATFKTTAPACPAVTPTGWNVDGNAPLPTIGAAGVTPGMPSGVPTGSITVSVNTNITPSTPAASTSLTYVSTDTPSSTSEAPSSASTSEGAAGRAPSNPLSFTDVGFTSMVAALIFVGAGVMLVL
jgi:1,3-beta-glucanosyltransferase GAS1